MRDVTDLVRLALGETKQFDKQDCFSVMGLHLQIRALTDDSITWIRRNLAPLPLRSNAPATRTWTLMVAMESTFADALLRCVVASDIVPERLDNKFKPPLKIRINDDIDLFVRGSGGAIWIVDRGTNRVLSFVSARERYPMQSMFSTARKMIVAHLRDTGWHVFHAAAVKLEGSVRLILGDSARGKTTLAATLMSAGGRFIGNDRTLLKLCDDGIHATTFPMPIGIGLGTAMQHPGIEQYINRWALLGLPQRRLRPHVIKRTSRKNWPALPDKLQMLGDEFEAALGAAPSPGEGVVSQVLVPNLNANAEADIRPLSAQAISAVLTNGVIPQKLEHDYPNWLTLGFGTSDEAQVRSILSQLHKLPHNEVTFFSSAEGKAIATRVCSAATRDHTPKGG